MTSRVFLVYTTAQKLSHNLYLHYHYMYKACSNLGTLLVGNLLVCQVVMKHPGDKLQLPYELF